MDPAISPITTSTDDISLIRNFVQISPSDHDVISPINPSRNGHHQPPALRELFPLNPNQLPLQQDITLRSPKGKLPCYGPTPMHEKFPKLVEVAEQSLTDSGFGAHRRRSETWSSVGVLAKSLREHVETGT